jgi:hypothetical protein
VNNIAKFNQLGHAISNACGTLNFDIIMVPAENKSQFKRNSLDLSGDIETLSFVTIPIGRWGAWTQETLDLILKVCGLLAHLKSLTLANRSSGLNSRDTITSLDFLHALTTDIATSNIERFSIKDIHSPPSPSIGHLFHS